ncbi:MAG TPA: DUF4382 domain-containing protein [Burkholderiaceae bacterium]
MNHRRKIFLALSALAAAAGLAACGGGGSSGTMASGMVNVSVTDAPTADFDHVWVTIAEIRFHTSNAVAANDPGWLKFPLAAPITVDLAALNNGSLQSVFAGITLPVGTYQQIRLLLVPDTSPLAASAVAQRITYNDEVDWTDVLGSHVAPLEIAAPVQGIGISGTFTVSTAAPLDLVLDFDVGHDVVRFLHNGNSAYTLKPNLRYFDLAEASAVVGQVDAAGLCTTTMVGCAYNLVIKSEEMSADGSHHAATRFTTVRHDGSFTLYPLRVPAGQTSTTIDVLLRGRGMDTMLVTGVPVTAGTTPTSNPTRLSSAALPLTIDAGEYTANASAALSPTGAWLNFFQTLPGAAQVPYEVRYRHVNPFTGVFTDAIPLSTGPIELGTYVAGGSPTLAAVVPQEGLGGFQPWAGAPDYTRTEAAGGIVSAAAPAFTVAQLPVNAAVASADSISGMIVQRTPGTYDRGFVVVVRMGTIVTTQALDSVLVMNAGAGGAYSVANLPGGSAAKSLPGAYYYLYARVWNSAHPLATLKRIDFDGFADLRSGSASNINATLN